MLKAMKKIVNRSVDWSRNAGTTVQQMSRSSSSLNKFSHYTAKNANGKNIPVGRSRSTLQAMHEKIGDSAVGRGYKKLSNAITSPVANAMGRGVVAVGAIVGAAGMVGVSMMNGMMSRAQDIAADRYMRDSRYSSRLLAQTNLGQSSGQSTMNIGNHAGLSLSMYKGRHG